MQRAQVFKVFSRKVIKRRVLEQRDIFRKKSKEQGKFRLNELLLGSVSVFFNNNVVWALAGLVCSFNAGSRLDHEEMWKIELSIERGVRKGKHEMT